MNLIYEGEYSVGTYDIDSQKHLTLAALTKMMHEAAMQNVLHLKLSYWDLIEHQITWVLMRKKMELLEPIPLGEKIKIVTHPSGFEKLFTYRDFKVYNAKGNLVASASSTWLLMDTVKRKMTVIPQFIRDYKMPDVELLPRPDKKIATIQQIDFEKKYQIGWFELDWNEHLNNIHYLTKMLDVLPLDILRNAILKKMNIIYKNECQFNDEIVSQAQQIDEKTFLHKIINKTTGKEAAIGQSFFV